MEIARKGVAAVTSSEQNPLRELPNSLRLETAHKLLKLQQSFSRQLGNQFANDIAISILLHCFISDAEERACFVDVLVSEYGPSPTTTWRWIVALQDGGLVHVAKHGRSAQLSLTSRGIEQLGIILDDF